MQQSMTTKDSWAKGAVWVSRDILKKPDDLVGLEKVIEKATKDLGLMKEHTQTFAFKDLPIQWVGFRSSAQDMGSDSRISEDEKYAGMMKDITTDVTVLFAHGGFYYTGSAATARPVALALARETGGRCVAAGYRLAPQHPFPAAVMDLLLAYLSLLYPAKDSVHSPVLASNIVFAGNSSGGNLVLSLLALLQHIRHQGTNQVLFGGRLVDIHLPAGIAVASAHCGHTNSFGSHKRNKKYDIFQLDTLPYLQPSFPACDLWPTHPPRADIYCEASVLPHPLVSVAIAPSWNTANMPPMFLAYGQEKLTDEGYFLAQNATRAGTTVKFFQYDALPHNFAVFFPHLAQSKHMLQQWGSFCRDVVLNPKDIKSQYTRYAVDDTSFSGTSLDPLVQLDEKDLKRRMEEHVARRGAWVKLIKTAVL